MKTTCKNPGRRIQLTAARQQNLVELVAAAVQLRERRLSVGELRVLLAGDCELPELKEVIAAGVRGGRLVFVNGLCSLPGRVPA